MDFIRAVALFDLFEFVLSINDEEIHVYGTSIFRNLTFNERKNWLIEFNSKTGLDIIFKVIQELCAGA